MIRDGLKEADKKIISILMIGQSNMAGRGDMADVEPIRNPNCYMLRMGRWQRMYEPINPDRAIFEGKYRSGISLGASFADELSKHLQNPVGMIPCADGGTAIAQWMPGEILFDHAVMMTRLAMRTSRFGGIIWHQGENDRFHGDIDLYRRNLVTMMTELRRQLNAEHLPLILGELSTQTSPEIREWHEKVNAILPEVAQTLPYCAVASEKGLTLKADGIHFNSHSCREFGKRYFERFISL